MKKQKGYPEIFPVMFYLLGSINGIAPWWASWFICLPLFFLFILWFLYELDLKSQKQEKKI